MALARLRKVPFALAVLLFVALSAINLALQPGFLSPSVMTSNLTAFLPLIVIAAGQTYVVLGGSVDLSLGAIVSLVNVIVVRLVEGNGGGPGAIALGLAAGLLAGVAVGAANGVLIGVLRLQPIIATFATTIMVGGLALLVLPQAGGSLPDVYYETYGGDVLGVPAPLLVLLALLAAVAAIRRTRFYTHLMAVGGNAQAAFQSGLGVARIRIVSHAIAGCLAAVAALLILGVTGAGDPLMGQAFTLGSVSAVVLGGTALTGGWGGVVGGMLGAASLGLINNVIFFSSIDYQYQTIVQALIVLIALATGVFVARRP